MVTQSGIILHKCTECDGIWMDKDELKKVEELVDGWKEDLNKDEAKYEPVLQKIEVEEQKELDRDVSILRFGFVNQSIAAVSRISLLYFSSGFTTATTSASGLRYFCATALICSSVTASNFASSNSARW